MVLLDFRVSHFMRQLPGLWAIYQFYFRAEVKYVLRSRQAALQHRLDWQLGSGGEPALSRLAVSLYSSVLLCLGKG